jgi:hypothetical protein
VSAHESDAYTDKDIYIYIYIYTHTGTHRHTHVVVQLPLQLLVEQGEVGLQQAETESVCERGRLVCE